MRLLSDRADDTQRRASAPPEDGRQHRCAAMGCSRLTQRSAADGLSHTYCSRHVEHIARHGSSWRKSLSAKELKPYRSAAAWFMKTHLSTGITIAGPLPIVAVEALARSMADAGPVVISALLKDESGERRAKQVLARMRDGGALPRAVLTDVLAVMAALRGLDGLPRDDDYRTVQIAKIVHRHAGGYRKRIAYPDGGGRLWQWHPEPRGLALRHLGRLVLAIMDMGFSSAHVQAVADMADGKA